MEKHVIEQDVITIRKTSLKKAGKIVFYIYVLIFSIFLIVCQSMTLTKINDLTTRFNNLVVSPESGTEDVDTLEISAMSYYKAYELDDSMNITQTSKDGDYMLYFHSDTCHYCLEANVFLNQYITLGYQDNIPIYFVTYDKAPGLFNDKYGIESTPTLIYHNAKENKDVNYVGSDEIFNLLDGLVKAAQ